MTGAGRYVDFVAFDLMSCAMIDFYLLVVLYFVKSHILSILRDTYYSRRERLWVHLTVGAWTQVVQVRLYRPPTQLKESHLIDSAS